jgi:hypothetical protein
MRLSPRFLSAVMLALAAAFVFAVPAQAQAPPPSLQGEIFQAASYQASGNVDISANCTMTPGETVTITYSAKGIAYGPYPGTFTESGRVSVLLTHFLGSQQVLGTVTSWTANFTIDSAVGQVSGTKTLDPSALVNIGVCQEWVYDRKLWNVLAAYADLDYEATISSAGARYADEGTAHARIYQQTCGALTPATLCPFADIRLFHEQFLVSTGVLPLDTTGKATGGGQLGDITSLAPVSFGFEVKQPELGRLQGRCLVNDSTANTQVKCLTVTSYQQVGNTATWEGTAEVNGVREHYRITVQDNGEPNQGIDTFSIKTESYEAAGNVTNGNVQLHKQELVDTTL